MQLCSKTIRVRDTEYWGSMITEARYYEYWSSWVEETCTRTYECGTQDNPRTCTETYDCSYCDRNSPYWEVYDDAGNSWKVSEAYYNYLRGKWAAVPRFIDMNRSIHKHWSCGEDGDAYSISWNYKIASSEAAVTKHSYINRVQASHSAFKLPYIDKKTARTKGLYEYPGFTDHYKQKVVLGADSIYSPKEINTIEQWYQYFNGHYGALNKVKLFVILYYDKPIQISYDQEAYWDGGNQNELVVCMSLDKKTKKIQWVRPFSWTDRKRVIIDIRDDVSQLGTFRPRAVYDIIERSIGNSTMYKSFKKDFSYLDVDLTTGSIVIIIILSLVSTFFIMKWAIENEYNNNDIQRIRD